MNARAHPPQGTPEPDTGRWGDSPVAHSTIATGACLCGTVHYAVDRPFETLSHYCDPNAGPAAADFSTFVSAPLVAFRWVAGEEWLTNYDSEDGARRSFCRWCGSSMPVATPDRAAMVLPLASLALPATPTRMPQPMPA